MKNNLLEDNKILDSQAACASYEYFEKTGDPCAYMLFSAIAYGVNKEKDVTKIKPRAIRLRKYSTKTSLTGVKEKAIEELEKL